MLSPGYSYDKAPDQSHFLGKQRTRELFRQILSNRKKSWRFNATPLFFEYLMGRRDYDCTPWGIPTYTMFGWQKPCYLLQDGYVDTFKELIEETKWNSTVRRAAIRDAPTAWCIAALSPPRSTTPSARWME